MNKMWFLDVNKNDKFSDLKGLDLRDLLMSISEYDLEYRESLGLSKDITFGTEIEYESLFKTIVDFYIAFFHSDWVSTDDGSLNIGGELNSPIMVDYKYYWESLKKICHFLKFCKADTTKKAGGHIHIGVQAIGDDVTSWQQFLKVYTIYEHVLYRFFYGDKISARKNIENYAPPVASLIKNSFYSISKAQSLNDIIPQLKYKHNAITLGHILYENGKFYDGRGYYNTIEFRIPNGTIEEVIWQNNINASTKLLLAAKDKKWDIDLIDYKFKNYEQQNYLYKMICLNDLLEFVDLVFNNNLDKTYFIKQYVKNYEEIFIEQALPVKKFVKR